MHLEMCSYVYIRLVFMSVMLFLCSFVDVYLIETESWDIEDDIK